MLRFLANLIKSKTAVLIAYIPVPYHKYTLTEAGKLVSRSEIGWLTSTLEMKIRVCIGGSVVECSPATRAARVRFPADASYFALVLEK